MLRNHWFAWFSLVYGLFVALPWLAPVWMYLGAELPARAVYFVYSFLCHQLPERSFFLFGPQASYSSAAIAEYWPYAGQMMTWRAFTGDPNLGWKVAWSDRMVTLYTSVLFFAWLWYPLRRRLPSLPWAGLIVLALPMLVDGTSHMISDILGMHQGFRAENAWLVALTGNALPAWFYAGDALGSFNSWMRLISGTLFGLGVVWFVFPLVEQSFVADRLYLDAKRSLKEQALRQAFAGQNAPAHHENEP